MPLRFLFYLQFIFLLFITAGVFVLFANFYWFLFHIEEGINKKHNFILLQGSASFLIMGLIISFGVNLWKYALALYHDPLISFIYNVEQAVAWLIFGIVLYFFEKYFKNHKGFLFVVLDASIWAIGLMVISIINDLVRHQPLPGTTLLFIGLVVFLITFVLSEIRRRKYIKDTKKPDDMISQDHKRISHRDGSVVVDVNQSSNNKF